MDAEIRGMTWRTALQIVVTIITSASLFFGLKYEMRDMRKDISINTANQINIQKKVDEHINHEEQFESEQKSKNAEFDTRINNLENKKYR